jgi:hypothetical protein
MHLVGPPELAVGAPWRQLAFVAGLLIVLSMLASVFTTLVVPRATSSRWVRFSVTRLLEPALVRAIRVLSSYEAKDRVLALGGPLAMVLLFVSWLVGLLVGFGLMTWQVSGMDLGQAFVISGSSVFTLGIASGHRDGSQAIEIVTSGTGLLVIALEIAYLPTLYSAFSTRETQVRLLATRAGDPAWGPELLARAQRFGTMSELADLYASWERWAAEVAESHTSYPSLMWFRSQVSTRSWLTALTAVLDAAALHNALSPRHAPRQSRLCLQMGADCLRALARAIHVPFDPDPLPTDPIRLTLEDFLQGIAHLERHAFPVERDPGEAWRHFAGWRVNYEAIVDALSGLVIPPPAPWSPLRPELGPVSWPGILNRTPDSPHADR